LADAGKELDQLGQQIQTISNYIEGVGVSSSKIEELFDIIFEITEQGNILAVNAALQAASAGEAERGFALIGEELQRLVQEAQHALRQLSALLSRRQSKTQGAVAVLEKSSANIASAVYLSDMSAACLSDVPSACSQLSTLIEQISAAVGQQSVLVGSVIQALQHSRNDGKNGYARTERALSLLVSLDEKTELLRRAALYCSVTGSPGNSSGSDV